MNRYITLISLLLLCAAFLLVRFFGQHPYSPDSYIHYTIGRSIIDNQKIPIHADLSFKSVESGLELIPHSWLADIILYVFFQISPLAVTLGLLLPTAVLTLYICNKVLDRLKIEQNIRLSTICLLSVFMSVYWRPHPLIFATPLTGFLILFFIDGTFNNPKRWYKIFFTTLLYTNMAGGYIFIPLLFAGTVTLFSIATTLLSLPLKHLRGRLHAITIKNAVGSSVLMVVASCVNPLGLKALSYGSVLYSLIGRKWFATLPGILTATNSSVIRNTPSTLPFSAFLLLTLLVVFGYCLYGLRRTDGFIKHMLPLSPLLIFIALGFFWIRFIPISALAALVLLAVLTNRLVQNKAVIHRGILLAVGFLSLLYFIFPPKLLFIPYPDSLISFIEKNNMKLNILSTYEYSGFTAYATYPAKANLDAQDDLFDENETISTYSELDPVTKEFFDNIANTYSVNTVYASKDADYLTATLTNHNDWDLYYLGAQGLVFGKKDSLSSQFVKDNTLSQIDLSRNLGFDPQHATEAAYQLERFVKKNPESTLAKGQLASIYRFQKNFDKAERVLNSIPADQWTFVTYTEMGRVKAAQGLCKQSEEYLLHAVNQRDEKNLSRAVLDLAVLYAGCLNDKEKATHYFKRYNSFLIPQKERDFVKKLMHDFNISPDN